MINNEGTHMENWITIVLEEYKTLRAESLTAMKNQQSILSFGTAAFGIMIAGGFNSWDKSFFPGIMFLVFCPIICHIVLVIWMGELTRMMRAGFYLTLIEKRINEAFKDKPDLLNWENWLRTQTKDGKTPQLKWNYFAIIGYFFALSIASLVIGNYQMVISNNVSPVIIGLIDLIEILSFFVIFVYLYRQQQKLRHM